MAAPMPAGISTPQDLAIAMRYGPQTEQAMRRSSYLTDALRQLTTEGGQNIRSGGELAAKLLATAILSRGVNRSQDAVMQALGAQRQSEERSLLAGTPLDPAYQAPSQAASGPAPAPQMPQPQPAAPETPPPQVAAESAQPQPQQGAYSPQDREALIRMGAGEAGGEGPQGIAAAMHVALNRLRSGYGGAKSLFDVIHQPHQFTAIQNGVQPDPQAMALAGQVADGVLSGQVPDPTGGAKAFLNPELTQKLYGRIPPWATGDGHRIGNHVFYGGQPQGAQGPSAPPEPPPAPDPNGPPVQNIDQPGPVLDQPYQVASNGPTPPPPSAPAQSPAAGAAPVGVTPQAPPAGVTPAVPHQTVMPEEWQTAATLLHNPMTRDLGIQELIKLRLRQASAVEMKPGTYWGQDGKPHAVEQFVDQPGSPNAIAQRSNLDNSVHVQANPAYGALPPATVMDPHGGIAQVPIQQQKTFRIQGVSGVFVNGPDGRPVKVGDEQYGPQQLIEMRNTLEGQEPVKRFREANAAWGAMLNAAQQGLGGMRAYALRDTFARLINPGAVARVGTIQAIKESQGIPAEIKGFFMNLQGDGNVPPEIAQQIMDVSHGFLASHYAQAKVLNDTNADFAKRHSFDPRDVTVDMGDAPQPFRIPAPAAQVAPATPPDTARAAAAAEVARRKAAGKWQGPQ